MYTYLENLNVIYFNKEFETNNTDASEFFNNFYILNTEKKVIKFFSALYTSDTPIDAIICNSSEDESAVMNNLINPIRDIDANIPIIINFKKNYDANIFKNSEFNVSYCYNPDNDNEIMLKKIFMCVKNHKQIDSIRNKNYQFEKHLKIFNDVTLVSITDVKGNITYANEAFCESTGYLMEELIGQPHNIVRHPDTRKEIFTEMWEIIQRGQVWQGKLKSLDKNKNTYWVKATIFPMFNENDEITEYMSIRFLTTEDEHIKRETRKKNLKMIVKSKITEHTLKKRVAVLEEFIRNNPIHLLYDNNTQLTKKNDSLRHQIKRLEHDLHISKNNESDSISNTVSKFRNIQKELHSSNTKVKALTNTLDTYKKMISKKDDMIVKLETRIHDLTNQIKIDSIELEKKDSKLRYVSGKVKRKGFLAS